MLRQKKKTQNSNFAFNIIDIFRQIKSNQLKANTKLDIVTEGSKDDIKIKGLINLDKLSLLVNGVLLPEGHVNLNFKGKKILSDIALYTSKNEVTTVIGSIIHGKNSGLDLQIKSNAGINNLFRLADTICSSFNIKDFNTLSANGNLDINFNIKSDFKTVKSSGYIKVPSASIKYALYNVIIDNINADIKLNNNIDIKNLSFNILSQPLKLYGTVTHDAIADLHIITEKLSVKGFLQPQVNLTY
jgi:hypothetical protein